MSRLNYSANGQNGGLENAFRDHGQASNCIIQCDHLGGYMPPTLKKFKTHIALGLSVFPSVLPFKKTLS